MRRKVFIVFGILFLVFLGVYIFLGDDAGKHFFSDGLVNEKKSEVPINFETNVPSNPFLLLDTDGPFSFSSQDNFNFKMSDYEILRPVSKDIITGIAEMHIYFGANEARNVKVTGWYTSSEKNASDFPNLGLARANAVKEYLIIQGIPSSRIELFGLRKNELKHHNKVFYGPVEFEIGLGASHSEENK